MPWRAESTSWGSLRVIVNDPSASQQATESPTGVDGEAPERASRQGPERAGGEDPERKGGDRVEGGPRSFDGVSSFMGMRWDDPQTVRLRIRPELINGGGLLSGVVTYALVDYCMGSTLWVETSKEERIATISISINYVQTAVEGEIVCRTTLDRRNRTTAVMRSEVRHEDGRLLVTAIGSYTIFPVRTLKGTGKRAGTSPPGAHSDGHTRQGAPEVAQAGGQASERPAGNPER
jgi:uncharacterized protein (TIGR00369 family)